jgi:hypothetical protein
VIASRVKLARTATRLSYLMEVGVAEYASGIHHLEGKVNRPAAGLYTFVREAFLPQGLALCATFRTDPTSTGPE